MARDWTPVEQPGGVLCSPACGGGCLKADRDRAQKRGEQVRKMLGPGWHIRVWENLGWHVCLRTAHISIDFDARPRTAADREHFVAYINRDPHPLDHPMGGHWTGSGKTPRDALDAALELLQEEADRTNRARYLAEVEATP